MSFVVSHLELEIDEWDLFDGGQRNDGENQEGIEAPAHGRFLFPAPHVEATFANDDIG